MTDGRPLRILYSFPHPLGAPTGIGTTAANEVRALADAGHHVTLYTTSTAVPLPDSVRVVRTMTAFGRRIPHRAIGRARAAVYHDRRVAFVVRRRHERFDAVHAWPGSCVLTFAAARRVGLPSFRASPSPHTASAFAEAKKAAAALGLEVPVGHSHRDDPVRLATEEAEYAAADFILCPSDYVVTTYVERGVPESKLVRHRYGFDPVAFPPPAPREPDRPFTAVFLGRAEPSKGLHHALAAWADAGAADGGRFLIAGTMQEDYARFLAPLLERARAERLGFVPDTGELLRSCDVLMLPSVTEGSALVAFEAMACGTVPLVSTSSGSLVRDGVDGFIHRTGDVGELTRHITTLQRDRDLLVRMQAAGVARRDELTWTQAGHALGDAYRDGIARMTARRG